MRPDSAILSSECKLSSCFFHLASLEWSTSAEFSGTFSFNLLTKIRLPSEIKTRKKFKKKEQKQ